MSRTAFALLLAESWRDILRLNHWDLKVCLKNFKNGASIRRDYKYQRATIFISTSLPVEKYSEYILHELLHILVGQILNNVKVLLEDRITQEEANLLLAEEEKVVTQLERIIYETVTD